MRRLGAFGGFGTSGGTSSRSGASGSSRRSAGSTRMEDFDIGGMGGFSDIFSSMFGGSGRAGGRSRSAPEVGQSVETTLEIPFRVAARGGKVPIDLEVTEECSTCNGGGGAPGSSSRTCPECSGRGVISFGQGGFAVN